MRMRTAEVVSRAADYLARHGVEAPRENAETLLMHVLGTDRAGLYARREGLDVRSARLFGRALCQRCRGVPLQHLVGEQQFFDLRLRTRPGVFVPRPETEVLVERALELIREVATPIVADVGTGTGAIALAVKRYRPDADVFATDRSREATALALDNAHRLGLAVQVLEGDLLAPLPEGLRGRVDLVVSNPPYITRQEYEDLPAEVRADPQEALIGGTDVHRRLAEESRHWLRPGGWLALEIGASQGDEVASLLAHRYEAIEVLADLAGRDRIVRSRLRG